MLEKGCRVCGSTALVCFLDLGDQPHGHSLIETANINVFEPTYPLRANFCCECTTVQIDYTVPKKLMFEHYLYVSGTTYTLSKHFEKSTKRLISLYELSSRDLVVDIGSNDGTWLKYFKDYGLNILGIDGAKNIAKIANERGVETWPDFFNITVAEKILNQKGHAKLITAAGVFFHLEELHSVTNGVQKLLANDGVFCIQAIYLGEMIQNNKFDQIYHEHLTYWTLTSLEKLLEMHGLQIFYVQTLDIHGGSIEVHACKKGIREADASVAKMKMTEVNSGYLKFSTYEEFGKRVWAIKDLLIEMLQKFKKENKTVYAMGAPIKGATLLNSFKIQSDLIQCAVEVNPLKIGKYIPGVRLPILDETTVDPPSAYLLLAWNFLPELISKYKKFIVDGGVFILPVPIPKIIDRSNMASYLQEIEKS